MVEIASLGWNNDWADRFQPFAQSGCIPARVSVEYRELYHVESQIGEGTAQVSGRLRYTAAGRADYPAVGDWVALEPPAGDGRGVIHAVIPRANHFSRKMPGREHDEQIVAANLDTVFLVTSLNRDLNPRRLERHLAAVASRGVQPVLILTKLDVCPEAESAIAPIRALAGAIPIHPISALTGVGMAELGVYLQPGKTVAMIGSSGVGKSTLLNRLLGADWQSVAAIRVKDDRGRHTTTHREMVHLPMGGLLIDNPGMREFQLWDAESGVEQTFEDIQSLAAECYFPDCRHEQEPRCAVKAALAAGELDPGRLESFRKLQREAAYEESRENPALARERKESIKKLMRRYNKIHRRNQRRDD